MWQAWSPTRLSFSGIRDAAGSIYPDAPERSARSDVKRLQVRASEGAVRHFIFRDRYEFEQFTSGREDVESAFVLVCGFKRRVALVQPSGNEESSRLIHLEA